MEDTSKKIKKNYKLMGTENDPVIIAQRLLNLYRQLHIFNEEKRESFNKMLVEQTPEVKQILGTLPGGLVLQQYLEEVEENLGITVEHFEHSKPQEYDAETNMGHAMPMGGSVVVNSDPAAIQGIVDAFKDAIISSEKNRKEDTKELAQTLIALQSRLTQSILERQPVPVSVGEGGEIIHAPMPAVDELVAGITKAQTELITELAHTQTQELSTLISNVLKEIQQMSTQSLIDAVQTVHKENMDFFKNHIFSGVSLPDMTSLKTDGKNIFKNIFQKSAETKSGLADTHTSLDEMADEEPVSLSGEEDDCSFVYKEEPEPVAPTPPPAASAAPVQKEPVAEAIVSEEPVYITETEPLSVEEEYEWEYVDEGAASDEEYEWEYVDENGNAITEEDNSASDEEYEWEYVDEDEYVEDTEPALPIEQELTSDIQPQETFQPDVPSQDTLQSDDGDISLDLLLGDDEMSSATILADEDNSESVDVSNDPYNNPIDTLLADDDISASPSGAVAMSTKELLAAYSKKETTKTVDEEVLDIQIDNE